MEAQDKLLGPGESVVTNKKVISDVHSMSFGKLTPLVLARQNNRDIIRWLTGLVIDDIKLFFSHSMYILSIDIKHLV